MKTLSIFLGLFFICAMGQAQSTMAQAGSVDWSKETYIFPNVLTTNRDGKNDVLVFSEDNQVFSLEIYNRWGMKVYDAINYANDFDGRTFAGELLPQGLYFYVAENKSTGQKHSKSLNLFH